ncbi:hypothetical protein [Streptomyces anulatus]|uniref:hypothetical protein n=1 Tax=Streptomyces anulatus TaxID=1892 RepID=UPI0034271A97
MTASRTVPVLRFACMPIGVVPLRRALASSNPDWFRTCVNRTLVDVDRGEDPATAVWTSVDAVRTAAEIETLAGLRRLATAREARRV